MNDIGSYVICIPTAIDYSVLTNVGTKFCSICDQSFKASTSVKYDSRVVTTSKLLLFMTIDS